MPNLCRWIIRASAMSENFYTTTLQTSRFCNALGRSGSEKLYQHRLPGLFHIRRKDFPYMGDSIYDLRGPESLSRFIRS
jgi:hypothetical protein